MRTRELEKIAKKYASDNWGGTWTIDSQDKADDIGLPSISFAMSQKEDTSKEAQVWLDTQTGEIEQADGPD